MTHDTSGRPTRPANGALTVITPLARRGPVWLKAQFIATRLIPSLKGLQHFDSVFFSNWNIITRLPAVGDEVIERASPRVMLWEVAYSAEVDPYIESFVHGIAANIKRIWGTSLGFPGSSSVGSVRDYIKKHSWDIGHLYWAYPHATVRTIGSALAVAREHEFLTEAARSSTPEEFARLYRGFLVRRGADL